MSHRTDSRVVSLQMEVMIGGAVFYDQLDVFRQLGETPADRVAADSEGTFLNNLLAQAKALQSVPTKVEDAQALAAAELHEPMALASDARPLLAARLQAGDFLTSVVLFGQGLTEKMQEKIQEAAAVTRGLGDKAGGWKKDLSPDATFEDVVKLAGTTINELDGSKIQDLAEELKQAL